MQTLAIIASVLFGIAIGWLIVYFVRKYNEYTAANLAKTASVFLSGAACCSVTRFASVKLWLVSFMSYLIGVSLGFFIHWLYQWYIAKKAAPKFISPRSRYSLLAGCNLSEEYKDRTLIEYKLECINTGYRQLSRGLISEKEFFEMLKKSGLTSDIFHQFAQGKLMDVFLAPELTSYLMAKGWLGE